ncbi:MAG: hypothetical protein ABJQ34_04510 [Paracoccaceae bacterium]
MDQITISLKAFFEETAVAFTEGRFEKAAKSWTFPNTIHAGDHKLFLPSYNVMETIMATYQRNLSVEDYAKTTVEVLQCIPASSSVVQALVQWVNLNSRGAIISKLDASYFCKQSDDFTWTIETIEFVAHPNARLADGIPFHRVRK